MTINFYVFFSSFLIVVHPIMGRMYGWLITGTLSIFLLLTGNKLTSWLWGIQNPVKGSFGFFIQESSTNLDMRISFSGIYCRLLSFRMTRFWVNFLPKRVKFFSISVLVGASSMIFSIGILSLALTILFSFIGVKF